MGRNLITVFLMAIIIALLMPIAAEFFASDPAFTPDNLITLQRKNN